MDTALVAVVVDVVMNNLVRLRQRSKCQLLHNLLQQRKLL
jgi:hypothetical protein